MEIPILDHIILTAEYKHIVLGLIFLKYISDSFEELFVKLEAGKGEYEGADPEDKDEHNGQPVFPPRGLEQNQLDPIQAEITNLAHRLHPNYFPITKPYVLEGKHILVLWCPAGDICTGYTSCSSSGK